MIIPGGRDRKYKQPGVEECLAGFRVKSEVSEGSEFSRLEKEPDF